LVFLVDDAEFRIDAVPADENESHSSKNLNRLKKYIELNMLRRIKILQTQSSHGFLLKFFKVTKPNVSPTKAPPR
jgi:hypothetical protein